MVLSRQSICFLKISNTSESEVGARRRWSKSIEVVLEQRFDDSKQQVDHCIVQAAPSEFTIVPGSITDRVDLSYRQLFLYVMRHHHEIIPGSTKMKRRGRKKTAEGILIPEEVARLVQIRRINRPARVYVSGLEVYDRGHRDPV